ncbi:MAG: ATP-binding cassette domain-containing protein [Thermoanaerobacteraceae bacterium]|nr:ATP-binding cassette domain-containing protein [Thermoanaerobacteraceae bacterium]
MIKLEKVTFAYEENKPILQDVTVTFPKGFTILKGPSGSGKSTLLRLLCKLEVPQRGVIFFRGKPLSDWSSTYLRSKVCYVQQTPVMLPGTVKDNLLLPFRFKQQRGIPLPADEDLEYWKDYLLLNDVPLTRRADKLSGGQKQRVALIRALLLKPEFLLLDEPTASLDEEARALVEQIVEKLNKEKGVGIIMISHNDYLPRSVPAKEFYLHGGRLEERQ